VSEAPPYWQEDELPSTITVTEIGVPSGFSMFDEAEEGLPTLPGDRGAQGIPGVGIPGRDGSTIFLLPDDPDEVYLIPGIPGAIGLPGRDGAAGAVIIIEPDPPEELIQIPGSPGLQGVQGLPAVTIFVDPDSPEEPSVIVGPPGPQGIQGIQGPAGSGSGSGSGRLLFEPSDEPDEQILVAPPMIKDFEYLGGIKLTANAITTGVLTIRPKQELLILVSIRGYTAADIAAFRFNGDASTLYWSRYINSIAGGVAFTNNQNVTQTLARLHALTTTISVAAIIKINNAAGMNAVGVVSAQVSSGLSSTAGNIQFGGFEWAGVPPITSIEMRTAGGVNSLLNGSSFMVFGRDYNPSPNL